MTKGQAVAFIVAQIKPPANEARTVSARVRERVGYAIKRGHLATDGQGRVLIEVLVGWCYSKTALRGSFSHFPHANRASSATTMDGFKTEGVLHALPSSYEECAAALATAYAEVHRLKDEVDAQASELAQLRPLRVARDERQKKASEAGKKGGRPPKG